MKESNIILLLGPGGVGKSTICKILAEKISYDFVDLDAVFCEKVGHIGKHIIANGYRDYAQKNSELFKKVKRNVANNTVIALSSGFLVNDEANDIARDNLEALNGFGIKILLLPDENIEEAMRIVVPRQLARGFNYKKKQEEQKYKRRHKRYLKFSYDHIIYSCGEPEAIVNKILQKTGFKEYELFLKKKI